MSAFNRIKHVATQLRSDKAKERQEGIQILRETFKFDHAVQKLDDTGDGRPWLFIFQALFETVLQEKRACLKKGLDKATPATIRRLTEAASTLRWLTERSVTKLNKKGIKALLTHILQMIVLRDTLFTPVAFDYLKALHVVLVYQPHLNHLDSAQWIDALFLAFNALLGDSLSSEYIPNKEDVDFSQQYQDNSDHSDLEPQPGSRKRNRRDSSSTPHASTSAARVETSQRAVSLEQIECAAIISILLQSPNVPFLSPEHSALPRAILTRLHRFFAYYPPDTSAHQDMIVALNATILNLELNVMSEVTEFGVKMWSHLLLLWNTKTKVVKENVIIALRTFFPLLAHEEPTMDFEDGVLRFVKLVYNEAELRGGLEPLSLESLRLEVGAGKEKRRAFETETFCAGNQFESSHALTWAALELQADCLAKLFLLSESVHVGNITSPKRAKVESPISVLLTSISTATPVSAVFRLQVLLFLIDRHWQLFHPELQQEIHVALTSILKSDDSAKQSWSFLCLGAISAASSAAFLSQKEWIDLWAHAIRRANVPQVSRAACHAASLFLINDRLPTARSLSDVEDLAKDITVQGPPFPYDSVCTFLTLCLKLAGQDVRLYRMQLEEKILTWLTGSWNIVNGTTRGSKLEAHSIKDILLLLETICGLQKPNQITCSTILPDDVICDRIVEERQTGTIRDYLLDAHLPPFRASVFPDVNPSVGDDNGSDDPVQQEPRAKRVCVFLERSLDLFITEWESAKDTDSRATAEKIRRHLDFTVLSLSFQASLLLNGTRSDRRVVQAALRLVALVMPSFTLKRWQPKEQATLLLGLEPLLGTDDRTDEGGWDAMLIPGVASGIKMKLLSSLTRKDEHDLRNVLVWRVEAQRLLWENLDVQQMFEHTSPIVKCVLRKVIGAEPKDVKVELQEGEDRDDFGENGAMHIDADTDLGQKIRRERAYINVSLDICLKFLTVGPMMQSRSTDPTRDKSLIDLTLDATPEQLELLGPALFRRIQHGTLHLGVASTDKLLDCIGEFLHSHSFSRSEGMQLLAIAFLDSTSRIWLDGKSREEGTGAKIRTLCFWLVGMLVKNRITSWKIRDRLVQFLDHYLQIDPSQRFWRVGDEDGNLPEPELYPLALIPTLARDDDVRVRFRVATAGARLFQISHQNESDQMDLYASIRDNLSRNMSRPEEMMTRFLTLGNIMVASSAVRRAPYWHLLEICFPTTAFNSHVEAVLHGVSERLGLSEFCLLFEAYASQIAFSAYTARQDFSSIPPHILGYQDRKDCAEASFSLVCPIFLLAGGSTADQRFRGEQLFESHCQAARKPQEVGLNECFGEVVGLQIVFAFEDDDEDKLVNYTDWISQEQSDRLRYAVEERARLCNPTLDPLEFIRRNVDRIVFSIVRCLMDTDYSKEGSIVKSLQLDPDAIRVTRAFRTLACNRKGETFLFHPPNSPGVSALNISRSLRWLSDLVPEPLAERTVYHVLHQLFAAVDRSPLVNEQLRLANAICLLCALTHTKFRNIFVLRTLMLGAVAMLNEYDLAPAAQSILEWSFQRYRDAEIRDPCFPDILSRIGRIASDYSSDTKTSFHVLGQRLLDWIENVASGLHSIDLLRPQVLSALPLWPRPPTGELADLARDLDSDNVSHILKDHDVTSSKFRLVRRLRDLAYIEGVTTQEFAKHDFWYLKSYIPSEDALQDEDIDAFIALLFANRGQIQALTDHRSPTRSVDVHHQLASRTSRGEFKLVSSSSSIFATLFNMLSNDNMLTAHVAYWTLRHIAAVDSSMKMDSSQWAPDMSPPPVQFYSGCALIAHVRPVRSLAELEDPSYIRSSCDFRVWIVKVTLLFSDVLAQHNPIFAQLTEILQSDLTFAEHMLSILVHDLLLRDSMSEPPTISSRQALTIFFTQILLHESTNPACIRSIVEVVLHLRNFDHPVAQDRLAYNQWLAVDFILLARGALSCGAHTTALLFLELAREYGGSADLTSPSEDILFNIYSHIDEPDGFYGIRSADTSKFLLRRFYHEQEWNKAFQFLGANDEVESKSSASANGVLHALHSFGFNKLAMTVLQSSGSTRDSQQAPSSQLEYELGWRTQTWDLPNPDLDEHPTAALYLALRAIHRERDPRTIQTAIRTALRHEMGRLHSLGNEDMTQIRQVSRSLLCLGEIVSWREATTQEKLISGNLDSLEWPNFSTPSSDFEFPDFEAIVATKCSLIRSVRQREMTQQIGNRISPFAKSLMDIERKCLAGLSEVARRTDNLQLALNAITSAQQLLAPRERDFNLSYEFASVLWMMNEKKMAVESLRGLLADVDLYRSTPQKQALLLSHLGEWASEACLEQPLDIRRHFFEPASSLAVEITDDPSLVVVFHRYALFAESQYIANLRSPEVARLKLYVDRKTVELQQIEEKCKRFPSDGSLSQHRRKATVLLEQDQRQYEIHTEARAKFLHDAILMYSRCLVMSDDFDNDASIRLCSLWFGNFGVEELNVAIGSALDSISSRKFVFLAHQLSARLSDPKLGKGQQNLHAIMARLCREHPFHSLYPVYLLRQLAPDPNRARRLSRIANDVPSAQRERATAAADLFQALRQDATAGPRVRAMEALCDAYLEWAQFPIKNQDQYSTKKSGGKNNFKIPSHLRIRKLINIPVPVSTVTTPVDPTCRYDDIVSVARYKEHFSTAGGINLPKITTCEGSDGVRYKQLFKGEGDDDLRQDAVMEQVFDLVNHFLSRDRETKKRQLCIRPYKVIPLASQAGLLEFVPNTTTMAAWLQEAHSKYRPQDWQYNRCANEMRIARPKGVPTTPELLQKLLRTFEKIQANFRPVMRHFFTEKHRLPIAWFSMRLGYSRSVATTSIVGHVLGLGDRHTSNILLDNNTGEVVHIDLGIAFDQGRLLPIPELVPFRLTADMVDGFGFSGTEGVFRRCSEETLRVLRDRSDIIKTVLEVFRYDPLHSWTASPLKIQRVQATPEGTHVANATVEAPDIGLHLDSDDVDESADRALNGVARKLDKSLSVEYTVNELISSATDVGNLSAIFVGWSPFM